jgi:hypothetical protein
VAIVGLKNWKRNPAEIKLRTEAKLKTVIANAVVTTGKRFSIELSAI